MHLEDRISRFSLRLFLTFLRKIVIFPFSNFRDSRMNIKHIVL